MRIWLLATPLLFPSTPIAAQTTTASATQSVRNALDCAVSLRDQSGSTCLEASSTPTFGMLLPYPGTNNSFDSALNMVVGGRQGQFDV